MEKAKGFGASLKAHFVRRRKRYILLLVLLLAAGAAYRFVLLPQQQQKTQTAANAASAAFIRTTTLTRTTLEDTISATGLVASADVSTVTTNLTASVKTVSVAVGDHVEEGDVICTLDTSEIEKQITRAQEKLQDQIDKAQESYETAVERYNDAKDTYEDYEDDYTDARKAYRSAYADYQDALDRIETLDDAADDAKDTASDAASDYMDAQSAVKSAKKALDAAEDDLAAESITQEEYDAIAQDYEDAQDAEKTAKDAYDAAQDEYDEAAADLKLLKTTLGFDSLESAYEKALSAYESATDKYENYEDTVEDYADAVDDALEDIEDAKDSEDLEDLYDSLEDYTLKAETAGYVTALNATVGSRLSESNVATIQDTDNLIVTISIAEYDIGSVELGMRAIITSDSIDGEVEGELTQISPVASGGSSSSATFSAEVSVLGGSNGLIIGVNAKVQLVVSTTDDVFVVPYDAVGTNAAGEKVVYVKTGGSGTDAVFEEAVVTTGAETDYYIEISGETLEEGMEVRASADLTEATFTVSEDEAASQSAAGINLGGMGNVGQATNNNRPGGGMGGPPSGGPGGM